MSTKIIKQSPRQLTKLEKEANEKKPRRLGKKVEKKEEDLILIPLDLKNVFYIGTSDFEKTHEFFKNSQYFLFQYEDTLTYRYTFKVDVKTLRVSKDENNNATFYLRVKEDKTIMITILDENGEEHERLLITYWELSDLIAGTTDVEDLLGE